MCFFLSASELEMILILITKFLPPPLHLLSGFSTRLLILPAFVTAAKRYLSTHVQKTRSRSVEQKSWRFFSVDSVFYKFCFFLHLNHNYEIFLCCSVVINHGGNMLKALYLFAGCRRVTEKKNAGFSLTVSEGLVKDFRMRNEKNQGLPAAYFLKNKIFPLLICLHNKGIENTRGGKLCFS
jgi:hypothetical protein